MRRRYASYWNAILFLIVLSYCDGSLKMKYRESIEKDNEFRTPFISNIIYVCEKSKYLYKNIYIKWYRLQVNFIPI